MARVNTIIVGGGVAGVAPFTVGQFTVVSASDPPSITDGNIRQDTSTPPKVFIGDASLTAGITVIGGATATVATGLSVVIGNGASSLNTAGANTNVVIGKNAVNGLGHGNVVLGDAATAARSGPTSAEVVVIGRGANITNPAGGANSVVIGAGASQTLGSQNVVIGSTASAAVNNANVVIGFANVLSGGAGVASCTLVGPNISTSKTRSILVGASLVDASTAGDVCIIGVGFTTSSTTPSNAVIFANSAGYTSFIVGKGPDHATPTAVTFRTTNGLGANIAGANLTLQSGLGTGTGASSTVSLASSIPIGAGSTVQTARVGFRMSPSVTATETDIMVFDVDNATLERVTVGAADSGGAGFKVLRIPN